MPRFVVAIMPSGSAPGLKMSRDITVEADNIYLAEEYAKGIYPDAKVWVRRKISD
jgi:hypothetical protein